MVAGFCGGVVCTGARSLASVMAAAHTQAASLESLRVRCEWVVSVTLRAWCVKKVLKNAQQTQHSTHITHMVS